MLYKWTISVLNGPLTTQRPKNHILPKMPAIPAGSRAKHVSWLGTAYDMQWRPTITDVVTYARGQAEICPDTGRHHIQFLIVVKPAQRLSWMKARIHPSVHWEGKPASWIPAGVAYVSKEDTRMPPPDGFSFELGTLPGTQGQRNDLVEAMAAITEGATVMELFERHPAVMFRYRAGMREYAELLRTSRLNSSPFTARPGWQRQLTEVLEGDVHPRAVHWYHEQDGDVGKSYFANHYDPEHSIVISGGGHDNLYHVLSKAFVEREIRTVFFDYPRDKEGSFPYAVLENLKNRVFTSGKYDGTIVRFAAVHVVVLCNFPPERTRMSADRWIVTDINNMYWPASPRSPTPAGLPLEEYLSE